MNRIFKTLLALLLVAATLTGCAQTNTQSDAGESFTNITAEVELGEDSMNYNFAQQAADYLDYIGTNLTDRGCTGLRNDHQATIDWIVSELGNAGYTNDQIEIRDESSTLGVLGYIGIEKVVNIVLTIPGRSSDKLIVIGGHYDGDGAGDNGSGLALLLANAVGLCGVTPEYDVQIVFFDAEEIGLVGCRTFVSGMSQEDIARTAYMVNIDSIAFGDYCNIYGGTTNISTGEVTNTSAYELACAKAEFLGIDVWGPAELDGYYDQNGTGPEITSNTLYTSPWTYNHPAPVELDEWLIAYSPATIPASDHVYFEEEGIPYVYFEATNWFAAGNFEGDEYTGYIETYDNTLGDGGMFMNTSYDTLQNLNSLFPGRALEHFNVYSPLLSSLILNPDSEELLA